MPANCPPGKIINPATNRCVSRNGTIGRKLLKQKQTHTKQPHIAKGIASLNLPPDILAEISDFLRVHNCGTFIRDTMVKYPNLDTADAQTKRQLKTVVVRTLEEFRRRLLTSHYIKRSFMKEGDVNVPMGKRIDAFIKRAKSTKNMDVLIDMCKIVVLMKREASVIVQHVRRFIQYVQDYIRTGMRPNDLTGNLVVKDSIGFLETTWHFASRETFKVWVRAYKRNLVKDEEALTNILQPVRVQV
jgi:hypothetical protein